MEGEMRTVALGGAQAVLVCRNSGSGAVAGAVHCLPWCGPGLQPSRVPPFCQVLEQLVSQEEGQHPWLAAAVLELGCAEGCRACPLCKRQKQQS